MTRPDSASADVRMRGFRQRHTVAAAVAWLDAHLQTLAAETTSLRNASRRVLAAPIISDVDVPGFDRATMDGYAVVAGSTEGATPYNRLQLIVIGDSMPGRPFDASVSTGEAVRIMTGAPMPRGADAVIPAELIELDRRDSSSEHRPLALSEGSTLQRVEGSPDVIYALDAVSPGRNVGRRGEDIARGTAAFQPGRVLRPQDLGVLSSIGMRELRVIGRPRVRLAVTGNELLPSGTPPSEFHIADSNGPMLTALIERDGGVVDFPGLVRDERDAVLNALRADADIVIVTGGSSVGIEDLAPMLVAEHGELAVHGIAMRPSSPTGLGRIGHRLIFLLPGNPVSSLCAYDFFAGRAIRALGGRDKAWPYRSIRGRLTRKISSPIGRLDYARVKVVDSRGLGADPSTSLRAGVSIEPLAVGGASLLSSTTRADGFVIVSDDSEGFPAGAELDVWLY